jgi:hypothetical protein
MTTLRTEQNRKLEKFERKFLCIGILQQRTGAVQIPQGLCKGVFQI